MISKTTHLFCWLLLSWFCFPSFCQATKLAGKITDDRHVSIPFVNVYVTGTSIGTTANIEGVFSLDLAPGKYDVSIRMIGYKLEKREVVIENKPIQLDVMLNLEALNVKDVVIRADAEDPAYQIIRNAQKKRKYYKERVDAFSCKAYVKSTQKLTSFPKTFMGQNVDLSGMIDSVSGIFYLSESVSKVFFKAPSKYKEQMISSRVSGSPRTYSFNQSQDVLLDLYDNLVNIAQITPRGIVSPIAGDAMFFYKYRFESSFIENGFTVNKISVIPKRPNDPVFTGTIYITDDNWRLYSSDLFITKNQQMEFLDTFRIHQNYVPLPDDYWLPFSSQLSYSFGIFGFHGNGVVAGVFSDYDLKPVFPANFSNGEVLKIEGDANKKDTSYWSTVRPIPLTSEEVKDYGHKDSVRVIHESKQYLDSMDRKSNKFSANSLIGTYTHENSYKHQSLSVSSPIQQIYFNTVAGWNSRMDVIFNKGFGDDDRRTLTVQSNLRYGLSNTHFNADQKLYFLYNTLHPASVEINAGRAIRQFNDKEPISDQINSIYSLWGEKNYMKLYEKNYISLNHKKEITNGFGVGVIVEYARRFPLTNTTDYKFTNVSDRVYTSNDPLHPLTDSLHFATHDALLVDFSAAIRFKQEYISRPEGKYNLGTAYPVIHLNYRKGIHGLGSAVDYDFYKISVSDDMRLGLLGAIRYTVSYGDFLSSKSLYFQDMKHFNGNRTWVSGFRLDDFRGLDYYRFSTNSAYWEAHAEYNMGGFILNKVPVIRKLKLREVVTAHYLHTNQINRYVEISAGIEKLNLIRAEFFTSFANGQKGTIGFLIGIKRSFGL